MVRYLFDVDLQGVGDAIRRARSNEMGDVMVIGHTSSPWPKQTPDELWMPEAARQGLVVFRNDKDILNPQTAEGQAWRKYGCRGFVLTLNKQGTWHQLQAIVRTWGKIEAHIRDHAKEHTWIAKINARQVIPA